MSRSKDSDQGSKRNQSIYHLCRAVALVLALTVPAWGQDFPGRAKYPEARPISTAELHQDLQAGRALVVDVRTTIEYDVIHAVGALHIDVANQGFEKEVGELAAANPGKKLAFYCNGVTCMKSYEAAIRAAKAGVKESVAYDAGIPDWAEKHPGQTLLLGKIITDPKAQLISKAAFDGKLISFEEFKNAAAAGDSLIIDVRDNIQRSQPLPGLESARPITLDNFIRNFVQKKANQDKKILIFDQVGRQVQWLQYYLVEYGYADYAFLKGGATGVLGAQEYRK